MTDLRQPGGPRPDDGEGEVPIDGGGLPADDREGPPPSDSGPRPWLERIGLAAIAALMGTMFALVAFAAGAGGEWILASMSAVGAFMTIAVGLATLVRG
jgi:hypothetical protein